MKKLVIIVLAILILVGGTVTAMKWLALGPFEVVKTGEEKTEPREEAILIDMEPIVLQVFLEGQIAATIQFQMKLETTGQVNASFLKGRLVQVSDAFVQDLHGFLPRLLKKKERLDVTIVKDRLKLIGERLLGKGYIDGVQIQSVTEKPSI